ncbi:MAG: hypothetical protein F6K19_06805 [Cyanothece sp. SIO1E1]|nr:hypothetical protein [Cyanothece sp. SIO1E1]
MKIYPHLLPISLLVMVGQLQAQTANPILDTLIHQWANFEAFPKDSSFSCAATAEIGSRYVDGELIFELEWLDDVLDARAISSSERRWKDPAGRVRDKDLMYFYDNLGIRVFFGDFFYEGWVYPTTDSMKVQWENQGIISERQSESVRVLKTSTASSDSKLSFELRLPLGDLSWPLEIDQALKITLLLIDADQPEEEDMYRRVLRAQYCVATQSFQINNEK